MGNKAARAEIAMIKVVAPNVALRVLDRAIQAHGGAGVSQDTFLAAAWANVRTLRIADGPDEVHLESIAKWELASEEGKNPSERLGFALSAEPRASAISCGLTPGEMHAAGYRYSQSTIPERLGRPGIPGYGMVSCFPGTHRTLCGGHRGPAMDPSGSGKGNGRISLWNHDRSWISYAFVD